jgi:hypothetical protein
MNMLVTHLRHVRDEWAGGQLFIRADFSMIFIKIKTNYFIHTESIDEPG